MLNEILNSELSTSGEIAVEKVKIASKRGGELASIYEMGIVEGRNPAGTWPRCEYCHPGQCKINCHECRAQWLGWREKEEPQNDK